MLILFSLMDTPKKTNTQPSSSSLVSKFEDSPVFNYISTLSPIKPLSLGHSGQSFHLLGFSSPQPLPTPPTLPREPKLTRTSNATYVPKNNFLRNDSEIKTEILDAIEPSDPQAEEANIIDREANTRSTERSSELISEISRSLKYEYDTPENIGVQCGTLKPIHEFNAARREILPVKTIHGNSKEADCSFENAMGVQEIQTEQNKKTCEWEKFDRETSDILNCHSPAEKSFNEQLDDICVDSGMLSFVSSVLQPPNELMNDQQQMESACSVISENRHKEFPLNKRGEIGNSNESSQVSFTSNACAVRAEEVVHFLRTEVDDKSSSQQQQATRRRCLIYEMPGSHYRKLQVNSTGDSPSPTKLPANPSTSHDKPLMATRCGSNKFSSVLPGIGLHLNALAAASKDKIIVKRQTLTCRRQLISSPSTASFNSVISDAKPVSTKITSDIVVKEEPDGQKDEHQVTENACENSVRGEGIKYPQSSPKKKRQKSDNLQDSESCKRCNCKRSKCLKLYCECFAAGLYCVEPCNCVDCYNKPIHEDTVLETRRQIESRNPLAFAPKVIRSSGTPNSVEELSKTPASARHKRGCNCKKSGCLKKYCECFQGGVGCSLSCRCEGCKNTFGCKEGPESIVYQESKFLQRNASDVSSLDSVPVTEEENHDQVTPELPQNSRQPVRRPFHFGGMIPHLPMLPIGSFPESCSSQGINETDKTTFEENNDKIEVAEEKTPETLNGDYLLPTTDVKSASPNCKRISPPHCDFETSSGWRSCRKLILRSIPPITNFTAEQESTELPGKIQ